MFIFKYRSVRILILLILTLIAYILLFSDEVLKYLIPQLQVSLVGLAKGLIGATTGALVGMLLYPDKIDWSLNYKDVGFGAYTRFFTILIFVLIVFYYA